MNEPRNCALPATLRGRDIVCVGFADWDMELWTNQQHLMSRLARANRVLFVESLGLRRPQLARKDLRRMLRRLRRGIGPPRTTDGVHVLSPLVVPLHGSAAARAVNARLLPRLVRHATWCLGMRNPVLWAYVPQAEVLLESLEPSLVVYHCDDDQAAQKGIDAQSFRAAEGRYAARADLVLASAPNLVNRMGMLSSNVLYTPNVADAELFAEALDPGPVDEAVAALPGPRIVFHGALVATKLDIDLLVALARARPGWSFAFVGPVGPGDPRTDVSPLRGIPNVHLLGWRAHADLPKVLRAADAGVIPYSINDLTRSVFPMKVYEYLAAGLPVVATPLPALEGVEGIATATDAPQMAARLEEAMAADGPDARRERSRLAEANSWNAQLERIATAIDALSPGAGRKVAGPEGREVAGRPGCEGAGPAARWGRTRW